MMKDTNLKERLKKVKEHLVFFVNDTARKKAYYIPLLLSLLISYTFSVMNRTVSVDDAAQRLYYANDGFKIRGLRWGQFLINRLFSTIDYTPFINRFFGVIFLFAAAVLLSALFSCLSRTEDHVWKYSLFSVIFVSYPLINEIWEYHESLTVPFCFVIIAFALLYQLINGKNGIKDILLIGAILSVVMSGYESLIFTYVTVVFAILLLNNREKNDRSWIKEGFNYALPLFVALILKYLVGYVILFAAGLKFRQDGMNSINWISMGFSYSLKQLIFNAWYYGIRSLSYLPIAEFDIAILIYFVLYISLCRKNRREILIGLILFLSVFMLPVIQGAHYGYRMAQSVQFFVALVVFLLLDMTYDQKIRDLNVRYVLIPLLLLVGLRQSICLHELLALNNQRSENEAAIVRILGQKLYSECDLSKKVIFVGDYHLGDFIDSKITVNKDSFAGKIETYLRSEFGYDSEKYDIDIVSTDVNSFLTWSVDAFEGQKMMKEYFSYFGFNIDVLDSVSERELSGYLKVAQDHDMKPLEIREFDRYILVYLG